MKFIFLTCILIFSWFMAGCWDLAVIENVGLVFSVGLDMDNQGLLVVTQTDPVFVKEAKDKVETLSTVAKTPRAALRQFEKIGGKMFRGDKLQVIVVSEQLARGKNLMELFDVFFRQTTASTSSYVLVSRENAKDILTVDTTDKPRIGIYLTNLIEAAEKTGNLKSRKLFQFRQAFYDFGRDPCVPIVKVLGKKNLIMEGAALFQNGTMVGALNEQQCKAALLMEEAMPQLFIEYEDVVVGFAPDQVKSDISPRFEDDIISFDINLTVTGTINEFSGPRKKYDLGEEQVIKDIETHLNTYLKNQTLAMLTKLQEVDSDIIGFGKILRTSRQFNSLFKQINWEDEFPNVKFNITTKTTIERTGALK